MRQSLRGIHGICLLLGVFMQTCHQISFYKVQCVRDWLARSIPPPTLTATTANVHYPSIPNACVLGHVMHSVLTLTRFCVFIAVADHI